MTNPRKDGLAAIHTFAISQFAFVLFVIWAFIYSRLTDLVRFIEVPYSIVLSALYLGSYFSYRRLKDYFPVRGKFQWGKSLVVAINQTAILGGSIGIFLFVFDQDALSRSFILTYLLLLLGVLIPLTFYLPNVILKMSISRDLKRRYAFVGSSDSFQEFKEWIQEEESLSVEMVGLFSLEGHEPCDSEIPYLGDLSQLQDYIAADKVSHIVLLETVNSNQWFDQIMRVAESRGCRLLIRNPLESIVGRKLRYYSDSSHQFFTLQREPLENPANRLFKRAFDIAVSLPVVAIILPLLCLFVWLRQRRESPGPLLFRQLRYGRNQEPFHIWKFRTMHHDDDGSDQAESQRALQQASRNDPRIYPTGAFLRKTSLDEMPQFINVLIGRMSVVGPRPHPLKLDESYNGKIVSYNSRHYIKPGITGLAQCNGFRGETKEDFLMIERIRCDINYLENWDVFVDITLTLKTIKQVFLPSENSY